MLDIDELKAHYHGREDMIREILRIFQEDAPKALNRLQKDIETADAQDAIKAAHTLANLCGVIRATRAAERARELQGLLSEADTNQETVQHSCEKLVEDMGRIDRAIADHGYGT